MASRKVIFRFFSVLLLLPEMEFLTFRVGSRSLSPENDYFPVSRLKLIQSFGLLREKPELEECQRRVKRRRKFGTRTGQRTCQREAEERRKLLSILKSQRGQHHDIIHFRHLLCPDPLCEVCNRASAMVHHLLLQESLDDVTSADSSSSTASVTESSFTETSTISEIHPGDSIPHPSSDPCLLPTSVISPKPVTPLSDFLSVSPRSDSLSPQPICPSHLKFPEDHSPPRPLALPGSSTHASQGTDSVIHPEATLSVTCNPDESSNHIPATSSIEPSSMAMSRLCQVPSRNVILPRLQNCDFEQENASSHPPRSCFCRDFDATNIDASSLLLLGLNVKTLTERQLRKEMTFQTSEMKENVTGTFSSQMGLEHCLTSSGNSLLSLAHEQVAIATKPGWDTEGKLEPLCLCQQLLYVKNLGENLKQKYRQLFWGLPSLHSESLVATVLLSNGSSSLEPHFVLFNGICSGLVVQTQDPKPPPLPHVHTLPLTHLHSQHFPQNNLQPQILPPARAHSRIHFQYPLTILPSSSPQIQSHKAAFHRFQSGADSHLPNQHLECFQKPESLWKLVPRHQTCQERPCSPDSNFPPLRQSSQTPVSVFPGHFHVNSGHRGQLELQVSKRQAPYCCVRVHKNEELAALMEPQFDSMDTARLDCRHACSPHSEFQGHRNEDSGNTELMTSRNFQERVHAQCQLKKDIAKNLANTLRTYSLDNPPTMSKCYQGKSQRAAAETKYAWMWYSRNDSMNELQRVSRNNLNENQIKSILRLHLTRKFWQIIENRIPLLVCHSWLAANDRLSVSQNCHSNMENGHSALMVGSCQINPFVLSFLHPKTQQILEAHIIRFQLSQKWGLPLKVLESIKIFTMREAKTWALPQLDNHLSTTHISGKDSKTERISQPFHGDKAGTVSSVPSPSSSLLAASPTGQEGQESPRQLSFETNSVQSENDQKSSVESGIEISTSSSHSIIGEESQKQTVGVRHDSPEQPTVQDEAEHKESRNGRVRFSDQSDRVDMFQESKMEDTDSEHLSIPNMYEEVFKAQELPVSPLQDTNGQTATNSQMKTMNPNQVEIATASDCCPLRASILKEPILSPPKEQLLRELQFKLQSRGHSQSPGCPSDPSFTADSWTTDSSQSESHSVFSEDITDPRVVHFHWDSKKLGLIPPEGLQDHKHILRSCLHKSFPPPERRAHFLKSTAAECRCEDTGLGTSRATRNSHLAQDRKLEGPYPPESFFRKKMRQFFQWFNPKRNSTGQEIPNKDRALFMSCGPPEAHELMAALGKILEETLTCKQEFETLQLNRQKGELRAHANSCRRHCGSPHCGVPSHLLRGEKSCPRCYNRGAVHYCSRYAKRVTPLSDKTRRPKKVVSFKDEQSFQSQLSSQPAENW